MHRFVTLRLPLVVLSFAWILLVAAPAPVSAQGFISPLVGFDFGGDSGCPEFSDCEDRKLNVGVAVGGLGDVAGVELEIAYARDFFGEIEGVSSSVLTVMGNLMIAPRIGAVQPYVLAGLGLIKSRVELDVSSLLESENQFGWDVGGGLMVFFGEHVGLRGDLRYFHAFQDFSPLGIDLGSDTKLDFGRAGVGVVFKF